MPSASSSVGNAATNACASSTVRKYQADASPPEWLRARLPGGGIFLSESLAEQYPGATQFEREGSGLLSILLPGDDAPLLIWFRAEQVEEISWAGNPGEALDPNSRLGTLNPRRSFATWRETVRGRSRPWRAVEIDTVRSFGRHLASVLQQQRVRELNLLLQQANEQLASLAATDALTGNGGAKVGRGSGVMIALRAA